jgi:hypothetical protein
MSHLAASIRKPSNLISCSQVLPRRGRPAGRQQRSRQDNGPAPTQRHAGLDARPAMKARRLAAALLFLCSLVACVR